MVLGTLYLLTRGPLAMFYGVDTILPHLSRESTGNHLSFLIIASFSFQITITIFKSVKTRRLSIKQILREAIVSNFLNVYGLLLIIVVTFFLVSQAILHYITIEDNSKKDGIPEDLWKNMLFITIVETVVQITPFRNMALR